MTLSQVIRNRRAVYPDQYNDKPILKRDLDQILEAANWAPTHKKTEPWRFKVLQGEALERFSEFLKLAYGQVTPTDKFSSFKQKKLAQKPLQSAAVIAICMQRDPKESLPEWEEVAAVAMAVQNMWLTASDLGIGAYWSSPGLISEMGQFFDFESGEKCLGLFFMGHYDGESIEGVRKPVANKTTWLDH